MENGNLAQGNGDDIVNPCDMLLKKRLGKELSESEIRAFVAGVVDGTIADYQISAMLMAICINGMSDRETLALTMAMAASGEMLSLNDVDGIKADKHSTGGVGDTTSLILVPLVAACGVKMAKMSGRGLGFTGGTLDKLESIPGMHVEMSIDQFKKQVNTLGCAIMGQTADLAPADKVLYALRDVTATVDCLPLVVSSILSKKLAAGCDVVVLDVKTGSGAVMHSFEESRQLAQTMVRIGNMSGKRFSALITDMDQPLGNYIGNALEVQEAIEILSGKVQGDLKDVSIELGAHILKNAGVAESIDAGKAMLQEKLVSGEGLRKLGEMIAAQGGDPRVIYDVSLLPQAESMIGLCAEENGWLAEICTSDVGNAAKMLGAGRERKTDVIDPSVGIVMHKRIGDSIRKGDLLCELHVGKCSNVQGAYDLLKRSLKISKEPVEKRPLVYAVIEE